MSETLYKIERKILYKELQPLFKALSDINYAVVKGEALSQQIYGETNMRKSGDIDILIDKKNVTLVEGELKKLGFKQKTPDNIGEARKNRIFCMAYSHQIPSYHKEKLGLSLIVDVNYDIFWGEYEGKRCSIDAFLSNATETDIYGITVKTLPIDLAFTQLILHHYKEMNSLYHLSRYNCIRTFMFKDINDMLIRNQKVITIEKILELCETYSIGQIVYYMLYYTAEVFNNRLLRKYLIVLQEYNDDELIAGYGLSSIERKTWHIQFSKRLDNDNLCYEITNQMGESDLNKLKLNNTVFS